MTDNATGGPFDPVEGVTLEQYSELMAAMTGVTTEEEAEARAVARGIPAGRYASITKTWGERVVGIPEVGLRYTDLYLGALRAQGITAPDITLEQYAEILAKQQASGRPAADVLADYGLTPQTYSLVSQEWAGKIMSDPRIAMRLGQLMTDAMQQASSQRPAQPPNEEPPAPGDVTMF